MPMKHGLKKEIFHFVHILSRLDQKFQKLTEFSATSGSRRGNDLANLHSPSPSCSYLAWSNIEKTPQFI